LAVSESPTGWYQDDEDPALARWWDGEQWTEHTMAVGPDLADAPPPPGEEPDGWLGWDDDPVDAPEDYHQLAEEELFPALDEPADVPGAGRTRFPMPGERVPIGSRAVDPGPEASGEDTEAVLDPTAAFAASLSGGFADDEGDLPFGPDAAGPTMITPGELFPAHRRSNESLADRLGRWPLSSRVGASVLALLVIVALAAGAIALLHHSSSNQATTGTSTTSSTTAVTFAPLGGGAPTPTIDTSTTTTAATTSSSQVSSTSTTVRRTTTTTRPASTTTTTAATTTTTAPTTTTTTAPTTTTTGVGTTGGPTTGG
jgi:hypothetical protein